MVGTGFQLGFCLTEVRFFGLVHLFGLILASLRRCLRKDKPEKMNETEEAALRQAKGQLEESANHLMMLYTSQQQDQGPDQTL